MGVGCGKAGVQRRAAVMGPGEHAQCAVSQAGVGQVAQDGDLRRRGLAYDAQKPGRGPPRRRPAAGRACYAGACSPQATVRRARCQPGRAAGPAPPGRGSRGAPQSRRVARPLGALRQQRLRQPCSALSRLVRLRHPERSGACRDVVALLRPHVLTAPEPTHPSGCATNRTRLRRGPQPRLQPTSPSPSATTPLQQARWALAQGRDRWLRLARLAARYPRHW